MAWTHLPQAVRLHIAFAPRVAVLPAVASLLEQAWVANVGRQHITIVADAAQADALEKAVAAVADEPIETIEWRQGLAWIQGPRAQHVPEVLRTHANVIDTFMCTGDTVHLTVDTLHKDIVLSALSVA